MRLLVDRDPVTGRPGRNPHNPESARRSRRAHRVALHIFRRVEPLERNAEQFGGYGIPVFTDAGRAVDGQNCPDTRRPSSST